MNRLVVVSHKETYRAAQGDAFRCTGGFALQIEQLSRLFDETLVLTALRKGPAPPGALPLVGERLRCCPLPEPRGSGFRRKLGLLVWLPRYWPRLAKAVRSAEVVHCLVPGDLGVLGILTTLLMGKPLWVRHCGTWGTRTTLADRFLAILLPRVARRGHVVQATGGGAVPPAPGVATLSWIFSTSIRENEMASLERKRVWNGTEGPVLVCVGRLSAGKNTVSALGALALMLEDFPQARLEILGTGDQDAPLRRQAERLGLSERVRFRGNVAHDEVLEVCLSADLFLFPTRVAEGYPKAVLEALACGLPVVAAAVSVLPDLIGRDCGRVVVDPAREALAEAARELLADPVEWRACSSRASERARGLTLEEWADRTTRQLEGAWPWWRRATNG